MSTPMWYVLIVSLSLLHFCYFYVLSLIWLPRRTFFRIISKGYQHHQLSGPLSQQQSSSSSSHEEDFIAAARNSSQQLQPSLLNNSWTDPFDVLCVSCALFITSNEVNMNGQCYICALNHRPFDSVSRTARSYSRYDRSYGNNIVDIGALSDIGSCPKQNCWNPAKVGFFCEVHGSKKEACRHPGCDKQAAYGTSNCKAHGGGIRLFIYV